MTRDEAFQRHCNLVWDKGARYGMSSDGSWHRIGPVRQGGKEFISAQCTFAHCEDPVCRHFTADDIKVFID